MEEHDHERSTHIFQKRNQGPLVKSLKKKKSHKSSYTILKGSSDERHGECAKAKINVSLSKTRFVSIRKSSTKGRGGEGGSTLAIG